MGSATRQYSKEEIIEKYQRHIDNYENIENKKYSKIYPRKPQRL